MYKRGKLRKRTNSTLRAIQNGSIRFKRRIDIQMWHPEHLGQTLEILETLVTKLRQVHKTNQELSHVDKIWNAQNAIVEANIRCQGVLPRDPRVRGAEFGSYTDRGWTETNGHDALAARADLRDV